MNKVLLISYYFPPCGGAAVQRWVRFLPGLVEAGYRITVLTTNKGDYPYYDESLLKMIPPEVEIVRTYTPVFGSLWKSIIGKKEPLPYGSLSSESRTGVLKKFLFWMRLNVIIPDARVIWNPYAMKEAISLCRLHGFNWIITTGPPHSTHLVGFSLKKRFRIKWMADFRDPWSKIYYLEIEKQNPVVKSANQYLERKVVKTADINLVVSDYIAENLPEGNKQIIMNGYNQDDLNNVVYQRTDRFRIKYIGQLTAGQEIKPILEQISTFIDKTQSDNIVFSYVGTNIQRDIVRNLPIEYIEHVPHSVAISEMVNSELLILIINDFKGNKGMLTTKLFEYIASGTPVLCVGPLDGEAAKVITVSGSGLVVEKVCEESYSFVQELYSKWIEREPRRNSGETSQWSVQQQIKVLVNILS